VSEYTFDGTPIQAGLQESSYTLTGQYPEFSALGQREMVIVDRQFVDDENNQSKSAVEYTCRDLVTGEVIHGVRRLVTNGGLDDGDDAPLRAAAQLRPTAHPTTPFSQSTPASDTDGDRVLVGFVEGSRQRAVIFGVLTHRDARYGATKADGDRRLTVHKGTSIEIKQDGTYVITRGSAIITITADGEVRIDASMIRLGGAALAPPLDGVVHGSGIDPFTGATYAGLNSASTVVLAKKV
jgi:hypothetical protein